MLSQSMIVAEVWWLPALLSGVTALTGVLIAQGVVLWIYRRNEARRADPELLRHCAEFSVAVGRLKRQLAVEPPETRDLSALDDLETAHDSLNIVGPLDIQLLSDQIVGDIAAALFAEKDGDHEQRQTALRRVFEHHMEFTQVVRAHFGQPERKHVAVPMIPRDRI